MIAIVQELSQGFKSLFPAGRFRFVLIVLSVLAAGISISELLVLKLFIGIVTKEGEIERDQFILFAVGILVFFLLTRAGQYYQRTYRVKAFARTFKSLRKVRSRGAKNPEWAMAFELSSLLTSGTQLVAIALFLAILDIRVALLNLLVLIAVLTFMARIFIRQLVRQSELRVERDGKQARPERRYSERIKAAETGGLVAAAGTIAVLGALLLLSYNGELTVADTLIIFFGVRLQNSALANSSRSMMRYARAKAGLPERAEEDE